MRGKAFGDFFCYFISLSAYRDFAYKTGRGHLSASLVLKFFLDPEKKFPGIFTVLLLCLLLSSGSQLL